MATAKSKAAKAEETLAETVKAEETLAETVKAEETPAEPAKAEETPAEPAKAEETPAEPAKAEETPAEPAKAEETPAEPAKAVKTKTVKAEETPAAVVTTEVKLKIKNNGARSFETYTRQDLPAGQTVEIVCRNADIANAIKSKLGQLNILAQKERYTVTEVK